MRILLALTCLACAGAAWPLETARELATAGAPHLALARVEQLQPREPDAPRWGEWEALRLDLLVTLSRPGDALKRAAALPDSLSQPQLRHCLLAATRAAVAAGQGAVARAYAARLLWQLEATPEEARAARLSVIDSYAAERQGETALRAMLRFEQDHRPLERATAERFVEQLLDLGREKEAVNWLASLNDASALKLRLQLKTGLATPDTVIAQARARLAKGGAAAYWQVLLDAAEKGGHGAVRVEALERLLHQSTAGGARGRPALAAELWQAYAAEAQAIANQNRLLTGDDAAWMDVAARLQGTSPILSRALFAHLARASAARETRQLAQLQIAFSLYQDGLDLAALYLFDDGRADPAAMDAQARVLLGSIAESRNVPAAAVRFWQGVAPPPNTGAEDWRLRLATMQWRAGSAEVSAATMRELAKAAKPLPDPAAARAVALAREMHGAGRADLAGEMLAALLPLASRGQARDLLQALGGFAESAAQYARAADYYLRAALADESRMTDALALQTRFAAAVNLARAGFREDARTQFQWLLKNSKDAGQIEAARRELSRL